MSGTLDVAWTSGRAEAALAEHWSGFEVLERAFTVPCATGDVAVELAGVDALGRLWLVVRADLDESAAWTAAIELLARARRDGGLFAAELAGTAGASDVRVALVTGEPGAELLRRSSAVDALCVLEFVHWKHTRGELARVVERTLGRPTRAWTVDAFLDDLAPAPRALAAACVERLPRLDPGLELVAGEAGLAWRHDGRVLARLTGTGALLAAATGARAEPKRLDGAADLDRWLATVFVERFGGRGESAGRDELTALPEHEPPPSIPPGPLLSAEELAAFRD
ncbi:MAG: hypothetical protein IPJ77_18415 [Planctomycetes bacterium]|nr:hypothetical protein [Planctomycetota bacterium]